MPRPRKCRRVCQLPKQCAFVPKDCAEERTPVIITVDEYETVRLLDYIGLSQEECGSYMKIARTTVQQIYTETRKKIATALVEGLPLTIAGGDYELCEEKKEPCGCGVCLEQGNRMERKEKKMKIAIPLDEDQKSVCAVFGRTPFFLIYDLETKKKEIKENPATEAQGGAGIVAAQFLLDEMVNVLLTPRCGENSAEVFKEAGILIYKTEGTGADENLTAYKENRLAPLQKFHSGYHGIQ